MNSGFKIFSTEVVIDAATMEMSCRSLTYVVYKVFTIKF